MAKPDVVDQLPEHVASLRRYALVLTRNREDAEDLVQECLVRAIAAADTWRPGSDLRVWLFRILHNLHVSGLRKQKVRREATLVLPEAADGGQHARLELQQTLRALDTLPEEQRQPIILVALQDMSYADAAASLDVPIGTFMSRLGRGRAAMRRIVNGLANAKKIRLVA
ncbi:sigma-70 family RNA polymerase sigma factor [Rubellimicrobium roseum]|uniref:Sigma-70 family RNA polymerase sigma factor n=1 Tax=Rubellimicrobium roseum TaxID=687525 RepID=A0A5C4ND18_9RHOB|nr:sigma-70 family RNA polymerase sigma factor [Rubellimicrobium roseum]TNC65815.1 sigma-70 family RNA polymerase sigma factor [Rubellimicrobium roseum]